MTIRSILKQLDYSLSISTLAIVNRTQSNINRSIEFDYQTNRTKSNAGERNPIQFCSDSFPDK